jgi:tRNA (guanosine-2'-O-)-methyltransferase
MKNIEYELIKISDPTIRQKVSSYLSTFLSETRLSRIRDVLENRTRHVTVVLEDLYQTQNISAVMRTCECFGVQDVHVLENENEFTVHKAISMGANKWLTISNYPKSDNNLENCILTLKSKGYKIVATVPGEESCFLEQLPIHDKTAFLFGTELTGLTNEAIKMADVCVKIPMYGFTESYNISNSVAIVLSNFVEKLKKSSVQWQLSPSEKEELLLEWLQKSVKNPKLIIEKYLK